MLRKKKKIVEPEKPKVSTDYTVWDKDFGFLNLIIERKLSISKNFFINVLNGQLQKNNYIRDEDIDPIVKKDVSEIMKQIGDQYKNFIVDKYFGNIENLITYVTEEVYIRLIELTVNSNGIKIRANSQKEALALLERLNQGSSQKQGKKSK